MRFHEMDMNSTVEVLLEIDKSLKINIRFSKIKSIKKTKNEMIITEFYPEFDENSNIILSNYL